MTKYTTIAGDMWDGIAYKTIGNEVYTDKLMKTNQRFRHLVVFPAGIVLSIPDVAPEASPQLPPWKKGGFYESKKNGNPANI